VGCGQIASVIDGKLVNLEGDPDHPINEGALCSKGAAVAQLHNNPRRLDKVLYRAPKSAKWEEKTWDWAIENIAAKVKKTRDATFRKDEDGKTVNRTDGIACLGGAALDNEECYLISKAMRSLGVVYLEHQARI
jgi:formate dehydrogenase major subunit